MAHSYVNTFIQNLNATERNVIEQHFMKSNLSADEKVDYKDFKLLKALLQNLTSETDLSKITGTKGNALSVLKSRMLDKTLEALTHDAYILNENIFSKNDRVVFKLRKSFLICKILLRTSRNGNTPIIKGMMDEMIKTAKEYEIYDVLRDTLILKKYFSGIRWGSKDFLEIDKQINYYNDCINALYFANDSYYNLILNQNSNHDLKEKKLNKYVSNTIKKMELDHKKYKLTQIHYFLLVLKQALSEQKKEYKQAFELGNTLLKITKNSKTLYRKDRIGNVLSNLSLFKIHLREYEAAIKLAKNSMEQYLPDSLELIISKELLFHALFYSNKHEEAIECIRQIDEHSTENIGALRKSKFIYYHANGLFRQKKFKEALSIINKPLEIEKDKSGWNISIRIFIIMLKIELGRNEEATKQVDSLRKHVERLAEKDKLKPRDVLIIKILKEIEKADFHYDGGNEKVNKMLKDLSSNNNEYSWEHYTPELIPFHEWLLSKKKRSKIG